jgi:hypothetical protein
MTHFTNITHIEDLPLAEFIDTITHLGEYSATEKVDGAQLLMGIDEVGFYTSRETKGGKRHYSSKDYGMMFHETYMKSAHAALLTVLPSLKSAGLTTGDQVELEVLFGEIPNVVPYSANFNYIVFLRTTAGTVSIDALADNLAHTTCVVLVDVPTSYDGITIDIRGKTQCWKFERTLQIKFATPELEALLSSKISKLCAFLDRLSGKLLITHRLLESMQMNRRPDWLTEEEWKNEKVYISTDRDRIRTIVQLLYKDAIKQLLLNAIVCNRRSQFAPPNMIDGWIEGVVLHNPTNGRTVKIVDKDTFLKVKNFAWAEREHVTKQATKPGAPSGLTGKLRCTLASALGHPALGTLQAKTYLKNIQKTNDCVEFLSQDAKFGVIKTAWSKALREHLAILSAALDKYESNKVNLLLDININNNVIPFTYSGSIDLRTKEAYALAYKYNADISLAVHRSSTVSDLIKILVGKILDEIR